MSRTQDLRRHRTTATLAAALVALGATGAAAAADRGPSARATGQAETQLTTAGSAVARCPSGKVVSGGFAAPGFSKESSPVVRIGSQGVGKREWGIDAVRFGGGGGGDGQGGPATPPPVGTIVSYAYCAKAPGRIKTRETSVEVQPSTLGTATARCGRGERAIAGGFASPSFNFATGSGVLTLTSQKAGKRGWTVQGFNINTGDGQPTVPAPLTALVSCLKGGPKLIERSQQASVGPQQFRTLDVPCPPETKAVSGGFAGNVGALGEDFNAAGAVESFRMRHASGWTTSAVSIDETVGATITGYVYCAPKSAV